MQPSTTVRASDGEFLVLDELPQTLTYNADGTVNYVEVTANSRVYRQTYTYTSGKVTAISGWVKQ